MRGDGRAGYDEARRKLDRAALVLTADAAAGLPCGQAALLTAAECGVRMFPGGVYLGSDFGDVVPTICFRPLYGLLADGRSCGLE